MIEKKKVIFLTHLDSLVDHFSILENSRNYLKK
jgi:hypothetical protein